MIVGWQVCIHEPLSASVAHLSQLNVAQWTGGVVVGILDDIAQEQIQVAYAEAEHPEVIEPGICVDVQYAVGQMLQRVQQSLEGRLRMDNRCLACFSCTAAVAFMRHLTCTCTALAQAAVELSSRLLAQVAWELGSALLMACAAGRACLYALHAVGDL